MEMASFPFSPFFYQRYYSYPKYNNPIPENINEDNTNVKESEEVQVEENEKRTSSNNYRTHNPIHIQNPFFANSDEPIIEILGIRLYSDDILILGLLFFLYKENVKDEMLFLSLILLLLS
jgi:hypothetical protein